MKMSRFTTAYCALSMLLGLGIASSSAKAEVPGLLLDCHYVKPAFGWPPEVSIWEVQSNGLQLALRNNSGMTKRYSCEKMSPITINGNTLQVYRATEDGESVGELRVGNGTKATWIQGEIELEMECR